MAVDENINDVDKKCKSHKDTYNISHTKINIKTMTDKVFKPNKFKQIKMEFANQTNKRASTYTMK